MSLRREQPDEFLQLHKYLEELQNVPEGLNREQIYEGLDARIPHLQRRDCTPRVFMESGVDLLLDQLIQIQYAEAYDLLLEETHVR